MTINESTILDTIEFDEENYMVDANAWTPEVGEAIAYELGIELTDRHWVVLNFCRAEYESRGEAPTIRKITKGTDVSTKEIYELFPGGPGKVAAQIAGLKKPTGCV